MWGVDVSIDVLLTSSLAAGGWLASVPGHFNPEEGDPGTGWIASWVGIRNRLDDVARRKTCPYR
jgi:hypothetical protein